MKQVKFLSKEIPLEAICSLLLTASGFDCKIKALVDLILSFRDVTMQKELIELIKIRKKPHGNIRLIDVGLVQSLRSREDFVDVFIGTGLFTKKAAVYLADQLCSSNILYTNKSISYLNNSIIH